MTIYISTGGLKFLSAVQAVESLYKNDVKEIELSGGLYHPNLIKDLGKFVDKGLKFQIHNYFPPPKKPFIINLASEDKEIRNLSLNHVFEAIRSCRVIDANYYSFHAGFLCDFNISEIGKKINKRKLCNRSKSIDLFLESLNKISKFAEDNGILIMVENNVLSKKNLLEFDESPFLMCDTDETLKIMHNSPKNIHLLIDVAHLKVSSNSLNFDPGLYFSKCNNFIKGYHLSDNNGLSDTNNVIREDSWFWKYLKKDLNYFSLEIYGETISSLKKIKKICQTKLK